MAKKGRHRKGGRVTPKGTRPAGFRPRHEKGGGWEEPEPEPESELVAGIQAALQSEHPLELLDLASALLALVDPRGEHPFERSDDGRSREQLVASFLEVDRVETSALLAAFAALGDDEVERVRIRRTLDRRADPLPQWLTTLDATVATRALEVVHALGDGDDVIVGVRLASGHEFTAVVLIDHNMGTLVTDAFTVPGQLDDLVQVMRTEIDPDTTVEALSLADARVRITEAVERGAITYPPSETETWPSSRALVEWIAGLLPPGGRGYVRPEWSQDERTDLIDRFFSSPFASADDPDRRDLLDTIVWFGCDYGPGDPLRWSPVAVEILLADWIPRKIVADVAYLERAPGLVRELIRFAHHERSIPAHLTEETLAAVDRWEPDYQEIIRTDRPQGPAALLAALGGLDPEDDPWRDPDDGDYRSLMRRILEETVGGADALDALDDEPLPDEPFDWAGIGDDVRGRVGDVLGLIDRACEELLDIEHRTAARRVLARIAHRGPNVLARGRAETAAAAICNLVGSANRSFSSRKGGLMVKTVLAHFGLNNSVAERERKLLDAGDFPAETLDFSLGSPDYLIGKRRGHIIDTRDRYAEM